MTQFIRRSTSYTQGVGRSTSFRLTLPGMYGSVPRCIVVCDSCGQSHDQSRNHLYDYPVEVDDDLQCQVCLQPLVDPVDTPCGHTFCYICLMNHLRRSSTCPCDREPMNEGNIKSSSILVKKMLNKLRVVCPNTAYCDAKMPRSSLEGHLRLSCPGTYIKCPRENEGCRHVGPRSTLEEHLWCCTYGQDKDHRTGEVIPITEGQICVVEIPKGDSDLGLLVSQCEKTGNIIVEDVLVEGNAYRDGRIAPGDQILEINNHIFGNKSLAQARLALASLSPLMRLTILRKPSREEEVNADTELIELVKEESRNLGIQIHSYRHKAGIFIYHVVPGTPADECGRIQVGDQILEANGQDLRYATTEQAALSMAGSESIVRLLVIHRLRRSSGSASSCQSNNSVSSTRSDRSNRSPANGSDHSPASRTSSGRYSNKRYEEVFSPTGFQIGSRKCIIVKKNPGDDLGMCVSGGSLREELTDDKDPSDSDMPVFVSAVKPGSPIDLCGKVQRGDVIMSINGTSLFSKSHSEAIEITQSLLTTSIVRLELIQGDEILEEEGVVSPDWREWVENYNTLLNDGPVEYNITLAREGNQSLGFSIVGGVNSSQGDSPIYIKGISSKSIAATDGRLQVQDELTAINKIPLAGKTQSEVVAIIRSCSGNVTLTLIPHDVYC